MNPGPEDTIAAISTPLGAGGIGIVRLSGPQALNIGRRLLRRKKTTPLRSHRLYLGEIVHPQTGAVLDEVIFVYMRRPRTYTREDVVEIQGHGGPLVLQEILQAALAGGARLAEPGEFTKRAFLNGRIDLTQAEAVIDLISSQTCRSLELANRQLAGKLSAEVRRNQEEIADLQARLEADIDFPEEEIPGLPREEALRRLKTVQGSLRGLLQTFGEGRIYREGISAAIVGKPNVGKSSLLNALLQEERAIVTPLPGTTRDVIAEVVSIRGLPLRLMDTAGLRPARDPIEEEGVRRSWERLGEAELAVFVVDGSGPLDGEDRRIIPRLAGKRAVVAVNKSDLPPGLPEGELSRLLPEAPLVRLSALRVWGIEELKDAIQGLLLPGRGEASGEVILTRLRHRQALEKAEEAICRVIQGLEAGLSPEFLSLDLRQSLEALEEILGQAAPEVLDQIFSQFCIGK